MGVVCSIPINRMCWSAGTRAVGSPRSCFERCKRKATPAVIVGLPSIPVASAKPKAWPPDEVQQLAQVRTQSTAVAEAIDLAEDFLTLVRQRQPDQLEAWLTRAATSTLTALRRFATGLYADYQAVKAGMTLPWSNGPVEGHINRLKMLKRHMFGRAHLDLLSRRFLRAPRGDQAQATGPRELAQAHPEPVAA